MNIVRHALEKMYKDTCNIFERQETTNPITKKTSFEEVMVLENQPCRLSFGSIPTTSDGSASEMAQVVKLFISPDIQINPGSKIVVTQTVGEGRKVETSYSNSGKPAIHTNHQEVSLELFERWS